MAAGEWTLNTEADINEIKLKTVRQNHRHASFTVKPANLTPPLTLKLLLMWLQTGFNSSPVARMWTVYISADHWCIHICPHNMQYRHFNKTSCSHYMIWLSCLEGGWWCSCRQEGCQDCVSTLLVWHYICGDKSKCFNMHCLSEYNWFLIIKQSKNENTMPS